MHSLQIQVGAAGQMMADAGFPPGGGGGSGGGDGPPDPEHIRKVFHMIGQRDKLSHRDNWATATAWCNRQAPGDAFASRQMSQEEAGICDAIRLHPAWLMAPPGLAVPPPTRPPGFGPMMPAAAMATPQSDSWAEDWSVWVAPKADAPDGPPRWRQPDLAAASSSAAADVAMPAADAGPAADVAMPAADADAGHAGAPFPPMGDGDGAGDGDGDDDEDGYDHYWDEMGTHRCH